MQKDDILSELLENIDKEFKDLVENDEVLSSILNRKERPAYKSVYDYAERVAELKLQVLRKHLSEGVLPDDLIDFDIADQLIPDSLKNSFQLISKRCEATAAAQNRAARIGMIPHEARFNPDLSDGLVKAASGKNTDEALKLLSSTVETNCLKIVDSYIRKEAETHSRAGLHPQISRVLSGSKGCKFCKELAGKYTYPDGTPKDVFRRHENCRCVVEYWPGDGKSQNVHKKQWKSAEENDVSPKDLEQRVDKRQRVFHAGPEVAKIRERILDSNVKRDTQPMEEIVDMKLSKPDSEIIDLMVDGTLSPKMNYNLSGKHIRNRDGLKDARSFDNSASEILAAAPEVERIVQALIGTGKVDNFRSSKREIILIPELTGFSKGKKTNQFMVIHSNTGWHIILTRKEK